MSNKIFVDANVIVDLLNKQDNPYVQKLKQILQDETPEMFINNLVVAEVLQGIKTREIKRYKQYAEFLKSSFRVIEVDNQIIEDSINIYRQCKANGVNFNNENICPFADCTRVIYNSIDCVHYATCIIHGLNVLTNDKVFNSLDKIHSKQLVIQI